MIEVKQHQEKIGNMFNFLNSILFILIVGFCAAQKPMVQLIVNPKVADVGDEVSLTIKTNIHGAINFNLPVGFVKGNQETESTEIEPDFNTGKMSYSYYKTITGSFTKEGEYMVGPVYVTKGKTYKSNIASIKIEKVKAVSTDEITLKQLKKPAFGVLSKSKTKIYEGEAFVLYSKVYSHYKPTGIGADMPSEISGVVEKHELGNGQEIMLDQRIVKGYQMFFFEYAKQLIFPIGTDKINIKPFKVNLKNGFEGYVLTSNSLSIDVIPLPSNAPSDFYGGVGEFSIKRSINKTSYKQGDFMVLTVVVSGEGNIHQLSVPKLNLPEGMVVYGDPIVVEDFSFGVTGSKGKITYTYNVQLMKSGKSKLPLFTFSYFDVEKEKYITLTEQSENLVIRENATFNKKALPIINQTEDSLTVSADSSLKPLERQTNIFKSPILLVTAFSLLSLFILFIALKRKKEKPTIIENEELTFVIRKEDIDNEIKSAEFFIRESKSDQFYSSIQKGLFLICSYSLKQDASLLSKRDIMDQLIAKDVSIQIINDLEKAFKLCEEARYGLMHESAIQSSLLENIKSIAFRI